MKAITFINAASLAEPLPELGYLVPALGIATGAPVLVAGYGYSGKTLNLQAMALSVATGKPLWGLYNVRKGRVVHLDFEQGRRVTSERYQRLALGMGVDLSGLGDSLALAVNPSVYLDDDAALEAYTRAFEGADLAIVDSLRAAAPGADENSSEVRRAIDLASRAAEQSHTVVMFIHHARKPKEGDGPGGRYSIRGSGALFDAAASVFVFSGAKDQPTRVSHEKCRNVGSTVDDFGLRIEDVAAQGNPRAGLRVVHLEAAQLASSKDAATSHEAVAKRIVDFLATEGTYRGTKTSLRERLKGNFQAFGGAFDELLAGGLISQGKDATGAWIRVARSENVPGTARTDDGGEGEGSRSGVPALGGGTGTEHGGAG